MLLTITTTCAPATDLGYLLHKHPDKLQTFAVAAGQAHVFYPEATPERCTAALLLEVDPIGLVRDRKGAGSDTALGEYAPLDGDDPSRAAQNVAGWRQGFLSNITNPKVLVFYLAVLPQFLTPGAGLGWLLVLAWSHAAMSLAYLLMLITGLHSARRVLMRRKVRRGLDATTGAVLLGFGAKLATEHV